MVYIGYVLHLHSQNGRVIADIHRANAFALFMKNQRKWESAAMDPEHAELFIQGCKDHNINAAECCLPHGSYLVNLAHPDPVRVRERRGAAARGLPDLGLAKRVADADDHGRLASTG